MYDRSSRMDADVTHRRIIVVLGMHRSGTSAIARGVKALGVNLGTRLMPPASGNNDRGFWEDIDISRLNRRALAALGCDWDSIRWIVPSDFASRKLEQLQLKARALLESKFTGLEQFGFKDPRMSRLLPLWQAVFGQLALQDQYVIALRNPLSVERSLAARDGLNATHAQMLWLDHVVPLLRDTQHCSRLFVDYDLVLEHPEREIARLQAFLQLLPEANLDQDIREYTGHFLTTQLRHAKFDDDALRSAAHVPEVIAQLYDRLREFAQAPAHAPAVLDGLDSLEKEARALVMAHEAPGRQRGPLSRLVRRRARRVLRMISTTLTQR